MNDNLHAKTLLGDSSNPDDDGKKNRDLSGATLRDYKLLSKLGQGAMGTVYLATQLSLGRELAVKILDQKFSRDEVALERFEREARSAARLSHHNIVQVFDYGSEKGIYLIATEYVDGGTVSSLINKLGMLEPAVATDLILQACEGLVAAEKQGIVHRDIKPENLMLTKKNRTIKIADFGLAKLVEQPGAGHETSHGVIVGTPYYMSPEQAQGSDLDYRSDIYSLGVTYYHMITGQVPFDADSIIGIMLKHISAERPDPIAINPSLPRAVSEVIHRMIAQKPEDRYQSASDALPHLRHLRDRLREGATEISLQGASASADRSARYKLLRRSQIMQVKQREVQPTVLQSLTRLLKGDSGVFIESRESFAPETVLEVQFTIPGKELPYKAIGIVRWSTTEGKRPGFGVTFVKIGRMPSRDTQAQEAPASAPHSPKASRYHMISPEQAIMRITESPLHCRMLRYYYANANQFVRISAICNALGVGMRMLEPVLQSYKKCGLLQQVSEEEVSFIWPDDPAMEEQLVTWISEFGLNG